MMSICLSIDGLDVTSIESATGDWIDESAALARHRFPSTETLSDDELMAFVCAHITLEFDGELDDASLFKNVVATTVYGPTHASYTQSGMQLSGLAIYMQVETSRETDESELEDLFHIVVPKIHASGLTYRFTEFQSYEVLLEDEPEDGKKISIAWP